MLCRKLGNNHCLKRNDSITIIPDTVDSSMCVTYLIYWCIHLFLFFLSKRKIKQEMSKHLTCLLKYTEVNLEIKSLSKIQVYGTTAEPQICLDNMTQQSTLLDVLHTTHCRLPTFSVSVYCTQNRNEKITEIKKRMNRKWK